MNIVAIIQARMGSTRLPGKILMPLAGKTVLSHVVERVSRAGRVNAVWIATTEEPADAAVAEEAASRGTPCFRGSGDDVLARFAGAAEVSSADVIVRVTADCPLFDGELLQEMLGRFERERGQENGADFLSNSLVRTYPRGLDAEIFTREALDRAHREAVLLYQREHVTPFFFQHPEIFRIASFEGEVDLSRYRWTLDTPEDWSFLQAVYEVLEPQGEFGTEAVLKLLKERPELAKLNADVEQKKIPH